MMHIAVINVFFAPHTYGGATVVAEELARRLRREHGVQISAISVMTRSDLPAYAVIRTEVDGMASWLINIPSRRGYVESYLNPAVSERLARILHEIEPDLAHVHCVQDLGADCLARLRTLGVPTILSIHDYWWLSERQFMIRPGRTRRGTAAHTLEEMRHYVSDIGRAAVRREALFDLAENAALLAYPSRFARDLSENSGLAPGRGIVLENGVRPPGETFFAHQAARRAADPRTTFAYVGGPAPIKGWPIVKAAFSGFGRSNFRGLVVDGSLDGSWWKDQNLEGLDGDWRFHPRYGQEGLDAFFAEVDVLLFLSQWEETYGLTIREAISRGVRVIQTHAGGAVEHGAADPDEMLAIGDGARLLRQHLTTALDRSDAYPDPVDVFSQSDQAREFLGLANRLLGRQDSSQEKGRGEDFARGREAAA